MQHVLQVFTLHDYHYQSSQTVSGNPSNFNSIVYSVLMQIATMCSGMTPRSSCICITAFLQMISTTVLKNNKHVILSIYMMFTNVILPMISKKKMCTGITPRSSWSFTHWSVLCNMSYWATGKQEYSDSFQPAHDCTTTVNTGQAFSS